MFFTGVHYWYAATRDMSCDNFFPVFLLYNGGVLNAFGWAFQADLSSSRFEHPTTSSFAVSARFRFKKGWPQGGTTMIRMFFAKSKLLSPFSQGVIME